MRLRFVSVRSLLLRLQLTTGLNSRFLVTLQFLYVATMTKPKRWFVGDLRYGSMRCTSAHIVSASISCDNSLLESTTHVVFCFGVRLGGRG
jgi:hypothetical protein